MVPTTMNRKLRAFALVTSVASVAQASPRVRLEQRAVKANETVELDGGEKVPAAKYTAELNELQEALESEGVSMRKADNKPPPAEIPFSKDAVQDKQRDKQALAAHVQKLDAIEQGGFAGLRRRRPPRRGAAGADRAAPPNVRDHRGKGSSAPPPSGRSSGGSSGSSGSSAGGKSGTDDDDALDVTYDETLGNKKRAAIYFGVVLRDTGENDKVGCNASVDGGVYLFDNQKQLVKMAANGNVAGNTLTGGVDLFVLGKAVGGFPKKGAQNSVNASKAVAPPAAKLKYGWGPISVNITGSIAGEFSLNGSTQTTPANETSSGRCAVTAEPTLRASAKASASVSAIAYKVGVEGQIVLLDIKTPMASSITVQKNPSTMTEDFRANVNATFLDGDVFFFVKTRIPQKGERFWDLDWDQIYKKNLFDWDGLRVNKKLAEFKGKQTSL
jgi:hypothetical protein